MSSTTTTPPRVIARWAGPALIAAALVSLVTEAIVATAWDRRPYSYVDDYVNFLGSPFVGEFRGFLISSPLWWLMSIAWIVSGALVAAASIAFSRRLTGWRQRTIVGLGTAQASALILFAVFPLGPARFDDGTLPLYLLGAFLSIIAGNALAVVTGLSHAALGPPSMARDRQHDHRRHRAAQHPSHLRMGTHRARRTHLPLQLPPLGSDHRLHVPPVRHGQS